MNYDTASKMLRMLERATKSAREAYLFDASSYTHDAFSQIVALRVIIEQAMPRGVSVELWRHTHD